MKTIIFALLITLIGCSETSNNVPVKSDKIDGVYNIYIVTPISSVGGDSVQVNPLSVMIYRSGNEFLEYPLEWNPKIIIR